jgi:2-methylisocitrate lyase-like PEP mutase family enzyme
LVGGSIEDSTGDPVRPIYDFQHAVERIAAAAEAAHALPFPFVLVGRAENFLHGRPDLDDTIRRLQAFSDVGADALYAPGLAKAEDIQTVCQSVSKPPDQRRIRPEPRGPRSLRARRPRDPRTRNVQLRNRCPAVRRGE